MSSIRLVAMDLDGTLLDEKRTVPEPVRQRIAELQQKGVLFTLATGRLFPSAIRYARQLSLQTPIIVCNGAMIRDLLEDRMLHHLALNRELALEVLRLLKDRGHDALRFSFYGDEVLTDTPHEQTENYQQGLGVSFSNVADLSEHLLQTPEQHPTMLVLMTDPAVTRPLTAEIAEKLGDSIFVTNSHDHFVEILHPRATKGEALAQLAASLSIPRESVMAIGDNRNDLSMIRWAGQGVLVANSPQEIQGDADWVTSASRSWGVLEALNRYFE
ncbi:HAD family phosphatase [Heliobacterium chlorum]|uniref:HAD family phosphatase n=1 Tax=Heliobacterium chlorum TaxID=2698 RepID=A0ABR7T706_HELCL|nr:Cof-type HAD-IIB family hydrolase [Heliobacterium chlorum]MBC9785798.1 HAD family phosphatase [Heliobacterium chlorum]